MLQPSPQDDEANVDEHADTPEPTAESPEVAAGTSTTGFETMLGKLVVDTGLVTQDELEICNDLLRTSREHEEPSTLSDVLVDNDFVTQRQLLRVKDEFEARKSTRKIPGYRILKKLGSGAMATVFLARQVSLDRLVAIKVLPKKFSEDQKFITRFYKEGQAAAKLNHPNIVQAYDVGQAGDHHYFVMEYVDGETVSDQISRDTRIEEAEAIDFVHQIAEALQHAHDRGIIHRDIKPKNIMVTPSGAVKLADLGLARAISDRELARVEEGRAYGTPYYISPEQIRGKVDIGPAADVYGLGATCYHMVTGRVPFSGRNPSEVMHRHLRDELVPPDHVNSALSPGFAQVIEMMMAKDPVDRYHSAADLVEDLGLVVRGEPPHFARSKLDLAAIATPVDADASIRVMEEAGRAGVGLAAGPLQVGLLVLLIGSIIGNLVLFAILLAL